MQEQKILHNEEIDWYKESQTQLNYELVFNGKEQTANHSREDNGETSAEEKEPVDIKALLRARDRKWKMRLKKAREAAFLEGFQEGKEQGEQQAHDKIDEKLQGLEQILEKAHKEWVNRQEAMDPGLLDLVFDLIESIVGLPVDNPKIRYYLDEHLSSLLHEADQRTKPVLWICESDYEYVEKLVDKYARETTVNIRPADQYNPGEFAFETDKETVVCDFKEMVKDFRENLSLPSWK